MSNGDPSQNYPQPGQGPGVHGYAQAAPDPQGQPQTGPTWNPHTGQWEQGPPVQQPPPQQQSPPSQQPPPQQPQGQYPQGPPPQQPPQQPGNPYGGTNVPPTQQQPPPQQPPQPHWDGQQWIYPQAGPSPQGMDQDLKDALDETKEELDQRTSEFGEFDYFKPKQPATMGDTTESVCRLLPAYPGKEQSAQPKGMFWKEYIHFIWVKSQEDPGKNARMGVLCEREMTPPGYAPAPCPVCDRRDQAETEGDQKMASSLTARPRFLFNVIDMEDLQRHWKTNKQTGQSVCTAAVQTVGPGLMKKLIAIFHQRQNIAHMQYGKSLVIMTTKVGKAQRDVRYDALDQGDPGPVPQGFDMIKLVDLSQVTPRRDYNEVAAKMRDTYPPRAPQQQQQPPPQQGYQPPPQQAQQPPQQPPPGQPYWDGQRWVNPPQQPPPGPPPGHQQPPYQNPYPAQGQAPPQGQQPPPQGLPPQQGYQQPPGGPPPQQGYQQPPPQQPPSQGQQQQQPYGQVGDDDIPF